ncbi:MAG TPA: metallopeptidase TldD-related protein [Thermoanaerobaculia bacterium]|nr:metallopeptidase TldD-related protein [Thermoanaerobaculia bacterium]
MFPEGPVALPEIVSRLERVLAGSPAEATEISWLEVRRGQESTGKRRRDTYELHERSVLVRVRESGRTGMHRTSTPTLSGLENAVREALAQARLAPPSPPPLDPPDAAAPVDTAGLWDAELARMTPARAREMLQRLTGSGGKAETARLGWSDGRIAVASSRGLRRAAEVTSGWIEVVCGRQPGAGRAAAASRSLAGLDPQGVRERACRRQGPPEVVPPPAGPGPVLLSQEAAALLIELLNRQALASDAFHHGLSFLHDRLGQPVFHPAVHLRDDPTDPRGLPFPFDLLGAAARPVDVVAGGVALTPAIDDRLARALDRPPTAQRVAPDEAVPGHLFLLPGTASEDELLRAAGEGVWISALDSLEAFDPGALRFRAVARGARQIAGGALGRALPDLIWEDDLPGILSRVLAVGSELVPVATGAGLFRATTAPMLSLVSGSALRPCRD